MINKVILVGNVGIDPEVRAIESGVKVARVRLATTERIFNRQTNESTEHTEWHTVILWRGLADVVDRFVRKGSQLYIEGRRVCATRGTARAARRRSGRSAGGGSRRSAVLRRGVPAESRLFYASLQPNSVATTFFLNAFLKRVFR